MSLKRFACFWLLLGIGLLLPGKTGMDLTPDEMNYHDFAETEAALIFMDNFSEFAKLETIGYSYDYRYSSTNPTAYPIYAIRISYDTPASSGDRHDRNGVLFDCACHAREWLTSESCLLLAGATTATSGYAIWGSTRRATFRAVSMTSPPRHTVARSTAVLRLFPPVRQMRSANSSRTILYPLRSPRIATGKRSGTSGTMSTMPVSA